MSNSTEKTSFESWDLVIQPKTGWFDLNLKELWHYRDLILLFIKRDFVTFYKQTVLGPLWYIIQPLFTTIVFTIIFGKFARIPTDGVPPFLFYMAGNVVWRYFADCLTKTSGTFITNASVFGKVYFPRLTVPISVVITNMLQFLIQFILFLGFHTYFTTQGYNIHISMWVLCLPVIILQMAFLGIGTGILISSLTTKYRDLVFALNFGVQLWMYATPVIYPLSQVPDKYRLIYCFNPMVSIVESFRYMFLGVSAIEPLQIVISWTVTLALLVAGIILFSRIEKTFMDTI
jgi:lipopolysaccharide transport system permease protein